MSTRSLSARAYSGRIAGLMQIVSIWFPYISPLVAWLLWSKDKLVVQHCKFRLKKDLLEVFLSALLVLASFGHTVFTLWRTQGHVTQADAAIGIGKWIVLWAIFALWGVFHIFSCVRAAIKAFRGMPPNRR